MTTTIDEAGRLVVPKEIRRQAGLKPKMPLEVRYREGRIEIEPAPLPVRYARRGRMLVAVPQKRIDSLTHGEVERRRGRLQRERGRSD
jgi:AbrB family looped-hinge helix DNA binding protein